MWQGHANRNYALCFAVLLGPQPVSELNSKHNTISTAEILERGIHIRPDKYRH
jgi:hypothetical protein